MYYSDYGHMDELLCTPLYGGYKNVTQYSILTNIGPKIDPNLDGFWTPLKWGTPPPFKGTRYSDMRGCPATGVVGLDTLNKSIPETFF